MSDSKIISTVHAQNNGVSYATGLKAGNHSAIADEPLSVGGKDSGPAPGDYLCMALASCKTITLRMYVQRKKWNIERIEVKVSLEKSEAEGNVIHTFHAEITVDEAIPADQKERLLHIAKACPLSKLLSSKNEVVTKII